MERAAVTQIWVASWDHFGVCLSCLSVHTLIICPCNVKSNHSPSVLTPFFSRLTNKLFTVQSREKRGKIIKWKHLGATFPWDALCVRSELPETISCLTFCFVLHRDANCLHERGSAGKKPHTHTHTLSSASQSWRWKQAWTKISPLKVLLTRWLWSFLCAISHFLHLQMVSGQLWGFGSDGWRLTYVILK